MSRLTAWVVVLVATLSAGCGGAEPAPIGPQARATAQAIETAPAQRRPGCGELCRQAGPPQGDDAPGCPNHDSDRCLPCPEGGCARIDTAEATAGDGLFTVTMRCAADHDCTGALIVHVRNTIAGRVAASDVSVPAGTSREVTIALTKLGGHVLGEGRPFTGDLYVFLDGTGPDALGQRPGPFQIHLRGARAKVHDCGGGIVATINTSCQFAANAATRFAAHPIGEGGIRVFSPVTHRNYEMACYSDAVTVYCSGGNDAFASFPYRR